MAFRRRPPSQAHFVKQQHEEASRRVEQKEAKLRALIGTVAFRQLVARNQKQADATGHCSSGDGDAHAPSQPSPAQHQARQPQYPQAAAEQRVQMPFLLVQRNAQ